jgi:hypothetical protein
MFVILKLETFSGEAGLGDYSAGARYMLEAIFQSMEDAKKHLSNLKSGSQECEHGGYRGKESWEFFVRELKPGMEIFDASESHPPSWISHSEP